MSSASGFPDSLLSLSQSPSILPFQFVLGKKKEREVALLFSLSLSLLLLSQRFSACASRHSKFYLILLEQPKKSLSETLTALTLKVDV